MNNERRTKVVVIQRIFPIYRKAIFDRLNKRYDFSLLHSRSKNGVKGTSSSYSINIGKIKYANKDTTVYLKCLAQIYSVRPDVVIHEFTPSIISIFPIILLRKFLGYKLILWGHGYNQKKRLNKNSIAFKIRKWLIEVANAIIFYSETNKEFINRIIPSDKYFVANNALDTDSLSIMYQRNKKVGLTQLKTNLGVSHEHVILFIGRLLEDKILPKYFVDVIKKVSNVFPGIGVYIIGKGPANKQIKEYLQNENVNNIYFLGEIYDQQLISKYLFISDLLLMPGYVGLAVNHAISFGCPVVTFSEGENGPYHSPEIEYLENYRTGYKAENYNSEDMANFINEYLVDKELQNKMKKEMEKMVENKCSIQKMESGFVSAINYCLNI